MDQDRAESWRRLSLWHRVQHSAGLLLADWPVPMPSTSIADVNAAQAVAELEAVRRSVKRGAPYGGPAWQKQTAKCLGLETTLRPRGRPHKAKQNK